MQEVIHRMTTRLWNEIDIPAAWGNSRLKSLWKGKGSKKDPTKQRGLSIGSTVCKLIINIILKRLQLWYEAQLSDEQNGFRKDRGTTDGIFTVKRVQQITDRKKQPLFLLFVDLSAAFDHINRKWLFDSIKLRFPEGEYPKLFVILENLYKNHMKKPQPHFQLHQVFVKAVLKALPFSIYLLTLSCGCIWRSVLKIKVYDSSNISTV